MTPLYAQCIHYNKSSKGRIGGNSLYNHYSFEFFFKV